ncbi:MAG: hypothetical protein J3Q66DRAFT_398698 [Benniella sp.]|nr:MAG: hypothetical protein J3Q66DRAFT_398698 [Benniella sp.]
MSRICKVGGEDRHCKTPLVSGRGIRVSLVLETKRSERDKITSGQRDLSPQWILCPLPCLLFIVSCWSGRATIASIERYNKALKERNDERTQESYKELATDSPRTE